MGKKKVVVVGGGFAGINVVKRLDERLFEVLLIDKINHHQFQPLFYQVATSQIEPSNISFPFRHILKHRKNVQIRLAEVLRVDQNQKRVLTDIGDFGYDYLVLAMGCRTNYFGNPNLGKHVLGLKSTYDAISIRNHLLQNFENVLSKNEKERESLFNVVIVGGGPTRVELAGAFAEIKKNILPKDFKGIDFSRLRIILVEGSGHTLNAMSPGAKEISEAYLRSMGVELWFEKLVKDYNGRLLEFNDGQTLETETVVWAAGVMANGIDGIPKASLAQNNRLLVDRVNRVLQCDHIFALGDLALMRTTQYPNGHPQLANVAINQAKNLVGNLHRIESGKELVPYEYRNMGSMATIGRNKAVVDFPFIRIKGFPGWFIWMSLHLMLILCVKNKLIIFINWAWAYMTKDTALRLILRGDRGASGP